jgi:hypothetical protein
MRDGIRYKILHLLSGTCIGEVRGFAGHLIFTTSDIGLSSSFITLEKATSYLLHMLHTEVRFEDSYRLPDRDEFEVIEIEYKRIEDNNV